MVVLRARDGRAIALGTALALVVAPLVQERTPGVVALAYHSVAGLLSGYLLLIAVRETTPLVPLPRLGGTVEAVYAVAAFGLGLAVATGGDAGGTASLAAALAAGIAAADLLAFGRDAIRLGCGAILGLLAAGLGQSWLTGGTHDLGQLAFATASLCAAAATAWLMLITFRVHGDLELSMRARDLRERA